MADLKDGTIKWRLADIINIGIALRRVNNPPELPAIAGDF